MRSRVQQAVILVGGRGTRLGPITDDTPKPMVPVDGRPFLDWQIEEVARFGFERITLLAGYKSEQIRERYEGKTIGSASVEVLCEPEPLGTAGGLRLFQDHLDSRFLLLNGDTLFPINLMDLPLHTGDALATLALRRTAPGDRYGKVEIDGAGQVTGFAARAPGNPGPINGGIYCLDKGILDHIGEGPVSLEGEVFVQLAAERRIRGALYDAPFIDIGVPEDLSRAQHEIPAMARRPAVFLDRDGVLIEDTGYPHDPAHVRWIPGSSQAVKALNDAGFYVFVVTNQAGVARGYYPEAQVGVLHRWMQDQLASSGAHVDAFEYCPHHPDGVIPEYSVHCHRRKPSPGMINDLIGKWRVDVENSLMIGDRDSDMEAAHAAGISGKLFTGGDLSVFVSGIIHGTLPRRDAHAG